MGIKIWEFGNLPRYPISHTGNPLSEPGVVKLFLWLLFLPQVTAISQSLWLTHATYGRLPT